MSEQPHDAQSPTFSIDWQPEGGTVQSSQARSPECENTTSDLAVSVAQDGQCWHVWLTAISPVQVHAVSATLSVDLRHADALFLNGYNSWTDSRERAVDAAMPGLCHTPQPVIDHWVLDASGDYRFAKQDPRPGHQHGIGYGYARFGKEVLLFGEALPDAGVTAIYEDLPAGTVTLAKEGPARLLRPGERIELMRLVVVRGSLSRSIEKFCGAMGTSRRPAKHLVGFTSWYRHYGEISQQKLEQDLDGVRNVLLPALEAAGKQATAEDAEADCVLQKVLPVFQVDDGYARVGDWDSPDPARFPQGMGALARSIRNAGLVAGLWIAPFVCERDSVLFAEHPDWILRDDAGKPVMSGSHWSGGYALDTLNPQVREHVRRTLDRATRDWGYRLLKLDFLYAAALVPHGGLNRGELMADALDLLRSSVPEGTLFDFCGVPVMSAFGRCEYCRIGCDVGLDWDGALYMRITGRERVSTKNSLGNTEGRAHLNGVAFLNDPDVYFLRRDVRLTMGQRVRLLSSDARLGGVLFTSDDMGAWDESQSKLFSSALETFVRRCW